jgi:hypothetical protein
VDGIGPQPQDRELLRQPNLKLVIVPDKLVSKGREGVVHTGAKLYFNKLIRRNFAKTCRNQQIFYYFFINLILWFL